MKVIYLASMLICASITANAQETQFRVGKAYNESVDSTAVPPQLIESLRKLAPEAKDVYWGHLFCTKCPTDGTYSYYQAEFYQGDNKGSITFSESAQPVAFELNVDLAHTPKAVQNAIGEKVKRIVSDFQRVNLEIMTFNVKEKIFFKVTFYIPTEDKKHWTPYDKLVFTEGGRITKVNDSE